MENSELRSSLKPCLNPPFTLPPLCRRHSHLHIQSATYRTLVSILSHCDALQSSPQPQLRDENDADKLREGDKHNVSKVNPSSMDPEISLVQQKSPLDETKEFHGFQNGGNDLLNVADGSDHMDINKEGNVVVSQDHNVNLVDSSMVEKQTCDSVIVNAADGKDMCSVADSLHEFSPRRDHEEFNEPVIDQVPKILSSSVDMSVIADASIPPESSNEKSPIMEEHLSEGLEHELQLKQKELEKLVSTSGDLDLSLCDAEDGEIEEGEISAEIDEAMDLLCEDAVSKEVKALDKVQVPEHADIQVLTRDHGDARPGKHDTTSSLCLDTVDSGNGIMELETIGTRKEQHTSTEVLNYGEHLSTKTLDGYDTFLESEWNIRKVGGVKETDHQAISLEDIAQHGRMNEETIQNKCSMDAEMEASDGKKKNKRGPLTKERRAKKKKKERIKRAEKNRQLGVKRLKLQPVLKPKPVTYCRHYLKGRCQEGEKCKFSHDTTPLTKSTPCSYFARHSCMKGDKCPFDHQLSKYPCNNIVTKGFCSRGDGCLFSHEISSKDNSLTTSNVSKPEFKAPSMRSELNSEKQVNYQGTPNQHVNAKFSTMENLSGKSTGKKVPENSERPATHIPKGICLISHVKLPPGNNNKHEQAAPHLKGDDIEKVCRSTTSNLPDRIEKSNNIAKGVPLKTPRGINFLSFGKRPIDDSLHRDYGVSESSLGQSSKIKLVDSPLNSEICDKIDNQTGQRSAKFEPNVNEIPNVISSLSTPPGMKLLSFGKAPVNNPNAVSQADMLLDNVNLGLPQVQEKKNALGGLKFSHAMPHRLAYSSNPVFQSSDLSGNGNHGGNSSSSKTSLLLNTPPSVLKAVQSTLAFAATLDSGIKLDQSLGTHSDMNKIETTKFGG